MTIHYFEPTYQRRARLKSDSVHGQALCSTGDAHQQTTKYKRQVDCERCLIRMVKQMYDANWDNEKIANELTLTLGSVSTLLKKDAL